MSSRIRFPYRAGSFYAATKTRLSQQIESCFVHKFGPGVIPSTIKKRLTKTIALISPHAGYMYSGPVAANGFHFIAKEGQPETIIIIGPNHTGYGTGASILMGEVWRTPLGDVQVNSDLAHTIQQKSKYLDIDPKAHRYEHSIEVQLPFLQYLYDSFRIIPICMLMQDLEVCRDIGNAVAEAVKDQDILMIASTDFSHYEAQHVAETKDKKAITAISSLDEESLHNVIHAHQVSMCGYGPVTVTIVAAKRLGATSGILLQYKTSGDITGDHSQVVGYASLVLVRE